ncbi:MAG: ABC transporter substrate-binding protein [Pseudochelatococcus sp.]|jgi:peptide/nickel transport system substrate-binding protein|uniref:ABC transporter substrate-binding protein n=1 Tax=Pseudochelatococcus sp. TaxID=2020869 RepID=UPI003D8AC12F
MTIVLDRRTLGRIGTLAMLASALGAWPAAAQQPEKKPVPGGSLTWGLENEPTTLNPHIHNLAKTKLLIRNVYEPLLSRTKEGDYVPWLATGYTVSDDGKTYTFTLRKDVKFTDGQPFNAEAVALNFTEAAKVEYTAALSTGPIRYLESARAIDDHTVELKLKEPYAPFLFFATALEFISPAAFKAPNLKAGGPEIAGTGPFILDKYVKGQEITYRKNPDYNWAPDNAAHQGPAYLDSVTYRFLPESSVRVGALTSGQVDAIEGISGNDAELFKDTADYIYLTALNGGTPFTLYFNVASGIGSDIRIRKALVAALDIDTVLKSVYRGHRTRAWGLNTPIDTLFYDAGIENTYGNDPALANKLLDEAGWTERDADGIRKKDGQRLTLDVVQSQSVLRDQRDVLLLALQAQARQNAGIDLRIAYVDSGTHSERRKKGAFTLIGNSNTAGDGYGLEIHYLPLDRGGRNNFNGTATPEQTQWLLEAAAIQDLKKRFELYAKLQRHVLLENAYSLPLYISEDQIAAASHVKGVGFRPFHQLVENAYDTWIDR